MPVVLLPRSLIALFPGAERRHELDGTTVDELLGALDGRVAGIRERLVDAGPRLRPHINVYVDGERAKLDTAVAPAATVHIIPAVSGGSTGPVLKRAASRPRRGFAVPTADIADSAGTPGCPTSDIGLRARSDCRAGLTRTARHG